MARPKGIFQKRDESKYWLPAGVTLQQGQASYFNKDTKLVFIDIHHGEFISSFKSLQKANASVHPKALSIRKSQNNPGLSPGSREKARATMKAKYGVDTPGQSAEMQKRSKETYLKNNDQLEVNKKREQTVLNRHGVTNVMKVNQFKENVKATVKQRYGVDDVNSLPHVIEKRIQGFLERNNRSKEELELAEFIESLGLKAEKGYLGGANPKELDIKIKEKNIAFEMNGVYFHSEEKGRDRNYHIDKTTRCAEKGIKLIHIFDKEWHSRKNQIKSFIRSALGKNDLIFGARNCEVRQVSSEIAREFLEKYHILGKTTMKGALGLFLKDGTLVSLVTYNTHHRNTGEYLLNRYITMTDVTVAGGLSKLSKALYKQIGEFSTFIDLRFSDGKNWITCGYEQTNISKPDYFYFENRTGKLISKQSRAKNHINTPKNMTEAEHAKLDGLSKIWDCGKIKLKYKGGKV